MGKYGKNYYKVQKLAKNHRDIVIAKKLSLSRERVRQLRVISAIEDSYGARLCTKCNKWFTPIKKSKSSRFRSTCGCVDY